MPVMGVEERPRRDHEQQHHKWKDKPEGRVLAMPIVMPPVCVCLVAVVCGLAVDAHALIKRHLGGL